MIYLIYLIRPMCESVTFSRVTTRCAFEGMNYEVNSQCGLSTILRSGDFLGMKTDGLEKISD